MKEKTDVKESRRGFRNFLLVLFMGTAIMYLVSGTTIISDIRGTFDDVVTTNLTVSGNLTAKTGRTATVVVAANDSSATSKAQADYVCDGVNDQVEIQEAIDGLPSGGGTVLLMEGSYIISSNITIPTGKKIKFSGTGPGTVLGTSVDGITIIKLQNVSGFDPYITQEVQLSDFSIISTNTVSTSIGIDADFRHQLLINNIFFQGRKMIGIYSEALNNAKITHCVFLKTEYGIYYVYNNSINGDFEDVVIGFNDFSYTEKSAIHLEGGGNLGANAWVSRVGIIGNNIEESDMLKTNNPSVNLHDVAYSTIMGNTITETWNGTGIRFSLSNYNLIQGNIIADNSIGNQGIYSGIELVNSSNHNLIQGNYFGRGHGSAYQKYGIEILNGSDNQLLNNKFLDNDVSDYYDNGTSTFINHFADGIFTIMADMNLTGNLTIGGSLFQPVFGSDNDLVLNIPFQRNNSDGLQYDFGSYGNDGIINGDISCNSTNGKYGHGCKFGGNGGYIGVGNGTSLDFGLNDLSIEFWIKQKPSSAVEQIMSKGGGVGRFIIRLDSGAIKINSYFSVSSDYWHTSSAIIDDDTWHHVCIVFDRDGYQSVYLDGLYKSHQDISGGSAINWDSSSNLTIGGETNQWFNSSIDEVKIYKKVLSIEEIRAHYLRGIKNSGVVIVDEFRIVNTTGSKILDFTNSLFNVLIGGVSKLFIDNSGNVGIGTTNPNSKLEVNGSINVSSGSDVCIEGGNCLSSAGGSVGGSGIASYIPQWSSTSNLNNSVIFQNGSNIGIGTTVSNQKFRVEGHFVGYFKQSVSDGQALVAQRSINEAGSFSLVNFIDDSTSNIQTTLRVQQDGTGDLINLFDGTIEVFTVLDGGNVGVSTTSPNNLLTINGTGMMQLQANTTGLICNSSNAGAIYYDGVLTKHRGCNSTGWNDLYQ